MVDSWFSFALVCCLSSLLVLSHALPVGKSSHHSLLFCLSRPGLRSTSISISSLLRPNKQATLFSFQSLSITLTLMSCYDRAELASRGLKTSIHINCPFCPCLGNFYILLLTAYFYFLKNTAVGSILCLIFIPSFQSSSSKVISGSASVVPLVASLLPAMLKVEPSAGS
ncbi:hypothetical protein IWZ00DRAFT_597 [Phyllosticta capitalensis]